MPVQPPPPSGLLDDHVEAAGSRLRLALTATASRNRSLDARELFARAALGEHGTLDELLRAARADPSAEGRVARWQQAEAAVLAELPIVPIGQFALQSAASERVSGLVLTATGTFDARTVSVAGSGSG